MAEEISLAARAEFLVWQAEEASQRLTSYQQKEVINSDTLRELRYGGLQKSTTSKDTTEKKSWVCVGDWYVKLSLQEIERLLHQNQRELQSLKAVAEQDLKTAQQELERLKVNQQT